MRDEEAALGHKRDAKSGGEELRHPCPRTSESEEGRGDVCWTRVWWLAGYATRGPLMKDSFRGRYTGMMRCIFIQILLRPREKRKLAVS